MKRPLGRGDTLVEMIDLAYVAADDERRWSDFLGRLCDHYGAVGGCLLTHDFSSGKGTRSFDVGLDPRYKVLYDQYFGARNPWLRDQRAYDPRRVHVGDELVPETELVRTEFYNDYLRPQQCYQRICGVVTRSGPYLECVAINRARNTEPFGVDDKPFLSHLVPHVERALQLHRQVLRHRAENESFLDLLDRLSVATLIVDGDGRPMVLNHVAENLLQEQDGLLLRQGHLAASSRAENQHLMRMITEATTMTAGVGRTPGGHLAVSRPSGNHPLMLLISPVNGAMTETMRSARGGALIITKDPEKEGTGGACMFANLYGLTPAEERLARLILDGSGLAEAALRIGISRNTARSQMKQIYAKTDTHSQADLIRLHARTCTDHH